MGKLDPSQQDRWWKSRIEKEELQYGIKEVGIGAPKTKKDVTFLNTLGQAQVVAIASESHLNGAGALVSPSQVPQRPPSSGSVKPGGAACSVASGAKAASVASQARSAARSAAKGSKTGSETQSALMKRLDGLEEALAAERLKRLQAEEEMRQLMALQQQRK